MERRTLQSTVECRAEGDGPKQLRGYASVFDQDAVIAGLFVERIAPGAFDDVLAQDVRGLFNHDSNFVLGRTKAGTLALSLDARGLGYDITPPDTQWARDLMVSISRGDVSQSSFTFSVADGGDTWTFPANGLPQRTIHKVGTLYDVSPVTFPAYDDTTVAARSLAEARSRNLKDGTCLSSKSAAVSWSRERLRRAQR